MNKGNKVLARLSVITLIATVAFVFLVAAVMVGPFIYNYNLSPLARLREQIHIEQNYDYVLDLCSKYYSKHKERDEVYLSYGSTDELSSKPRSAPEGKYIHLYHWIFLDDLQLTVYFGADNHVAYVDFLGD